MLNFQFIVLLLHDLGPVPTSTSTSTSTSTFGVVTEQPNFVVKTDTFDIGDIVECSTLKSVPSSPQLSPPQSTSPIGTPTVTEKGSRKYMGTLTTPEHHGGSGSGHGSGGGGGGYSHSYSYSSTGDIEESGTTEEAEANQADGKRLPHKKNEENDRNADGVEDGVEVEVEVEVDDDEDREFERPTDRSTGDREYLKELLSAHAIWHDGHFWEQALWQCAVEQVLYALTDIIK
jgi:hypothetical protein